MEQTIKKIKDKGYKLTPQRIAIVDFLEGSRDHPSAVDIIAQIKKQFPTVSVATVYNTIHMLKSKGELFEITIDPDKKRYDFNITPHHHIICNSCRKIENVIADYSNILKLPKKIKEHFTQTGSSINFYGICKKCRSDT